jgi:hypothetical protein
MRRRFKLTPPWPAVPDANVTVIRWCFADAETAAAFASQFKQ